MVFFTAVFDALDGIVARIREMSSKRGDLVDHTLDRVADIIILIIVDSLGSTVPLSGSISTKTFRVFLVKEFL